MNNSFPAILDPASRIPINANLRYVYVLWRKDEIVYVGYTKFLEQRIQQHQKLKGVKKDFDAYSYASFDSTDAAINFERELIKNLKPQLNRQILTSKYREQEMEAAL